MLLPATSASSKEAVIEEQIVSKGKKRTFFLVAPASKSGPLPLLITLQGNGRDAKKSVERWAEIANKEGIIVASPVASQRSGWRASEDGPEFFRQVVEAIKAKRSVNARRVYVLGGHQSAPLAFALGLIDSEYYAAAVGYAGALDTFAFDLVDNARRKIPTAIVVGMADPIFSFENLKTMRDMLNSRRIPVEIIELAEHDNDYGKGFAVVNQAAWNFLSRHELPESR
jgi:poly(3-hydroxybutyrate) depolymerase